MTIRRTAVLSLLTLLTGCSTGVELGVSGALSGPSTDLARLEQRTVETTPDGVGIMVVRPTIASRDDLLRYRELKVAEAAEILAVTGERATKTPYYPVIVTLAQPITLAELNDLISQYDPSLQKKVSAAGPSLSKYLAKAELVKDSDQLLPHAVRFLSSTGRGQLSYETMTNAEELAALEAGLAAQEEQENGIADFQLVAGVTVVLGGVHRDGLMPLNNDPRVFLADVGPRELYTGEVQDAIWDDVSNLVATYLPN